MWRWLIRGVHTWLSRKSVPRSCDSRVHVWPGSVRKARLCECSASGTPCNWVWLMKFACEVNRDCASGVIPYEMCACASTVWNLVKLLDKKQCVTQLIDKPRFQTVGRKQRSDGDSTNLLWPPIVYEKGIVYLTGVRNCARVIAERWREPVREMPTRAQINLAMAGESDHYEFKCASYVCL